MDGCRNPQNFNIWSNLAFFAVTVQNLIKVPSLLWYFSHTKLTFAWLKHTHTHTHTTSSLSVKEMGTENLKFTSWTNCVFWWFLCHSDDSIYFSMGLLSHPSLATIWPPLYRTTCVSRHFELRTGGSCWSKVLLPACLVINATKILLLLQCTWLSTHALRFVYISIL